MKPLSYWFPCVAVFVLLAPSALWAQTSAGERYVFASKVQHERNFMSCCAKEKGLLVFTGDVAFHSGGSRLGETLARTPVDQVGWYWWWQFQRERYVRTAHLLPAQMESATEGAQGPRRNEAARALAAILAEGRNDWKLRAAAVHGLARLARESDQAQPALAMALEDAKSDVRLAAALGLGFTAEAEAEVVLARRLADPRTDSLEIAYGLVALGHTPGGAARLVAFAQAPRDVLLQAAMLLGLKASRDSAAVAVLSGYAGNEANGLTIRALALSALGDCDREGTSLGLLDRVARGGEPLLADAAILALGGIKLPRAGEVLRSLSQAQLKPAVRGTLLLALGQNGGPVARAILEAALADERRQMPWAALGLGLLGDPASRPALLAQAKRAQGGQLDTGALALALGLLKAPELAGLLVAWGKRAEVEVQAMLAEAAGLSGDAAAYPWLAELGAKTDHPEVARSCAIAGAMLDHVTQVAEWLALARASKDMYRTRAAVRITGDLPDPELAAPPLLEILERSKDLPSRVQAAFALGQLFDRARWAALEPRANHMARLGLGLAYPVIFKHDLLEPLFSLP